MELLPELLVDGLSPGRPAVSPDGRWVAYVVEPVTFTGELWSLLWVAPVDGSAPPRQLTDGKRLVAQPRWTADSTALVFLADGQLMRIDPSGGDQRELLSWDGGILDHRPLADGAIAFIAPPQPGASAAGESDVIVWGTEPGDGLWLLPPGQGSPRRLTGLGALDGRHVVTAEVRPDGRALAVISWDVPAEEPGAWTARLHVVDLASGAAQDLGPTAMYADSPVWWRAGGGDGHDAHDWHVSYLGTTPPGGAGGRAVLDVTVPESGVAALPAAATSADACRHRDLTEGLDVCPTDLVQHPDGRPPLALFAEGLDSALRRYDPATGCFDRLTVIPGRADGPAVDGTGEVVALLISAGHAPVDVHVRRGAEAFRQVSDTRPHFREVVWGAQERLSWRAPDGLEIEGVLVLPPGRTRADGPFPLHVSLHGGPYERWADQLQFQWYLSAQWLAACGHAVLMPNPRGSEGRGHAFAAMVSGDVGGAEYTDIIAGVDHLVDAGVADPERLSVSGWSHGGYMAAWAVTRTDRFRASIVGAGIADWGLQVAHGELGTQEAFLGGSTGWEGPGPHPHDAVSPVSYAAAITTPVLILHGEADTNVPLSQAIYLQRALSHHGVPHQLAVYPGAGHIVAGREHQRDIMLRARDFLAEHVLLAGQAEDAREAAGCEGDRADK
ncbi:S9 family peptidase [Streptacidiphilus fuscans]|uniref:S9 family peptidase n=1 Tax=Streptacidiphilus fuscans TaxID=2789292 RepID=A0A931B3H6_9ACTN|nr:prolyl oligopeptidase family serine peptidase [Streptacidiphilus fuscans]MBF9069566.1 S9 family peptidase [Streptacidiphilus fuscans]